MPTEMELTLEQTQQGVSYEVSVFTMKMEILLEPTSNKLMVEHAEYDESNTYVLERFNTTAGNPVKKILLKLNLSDHRLFKDGGGDFRYSDTTHLSRSVEVLKLKNFKKDATLKLFKNGLVLVVIQLWSLEFGLGLHLFEGFKEWKRPVGTLQKESAQCCQLSVKAMYLLERSWWFKVSDFLDLRRIGFDSLLGDEVP
ncbi:hypothetical protein Tco_0697979 [Tanacetum coccineum]